GPRRVPAGLPPPPLTLRRAGRTPRVVPRGGPPPAVPSADARRRPRSRPGPIGAPGGGVTGVPIDARAAVPSPAPPRPCRSGVAQRWAAEERTVGLETGRHGALPPV